MPKQTFFNLPKEKQEILMHSAKKEFSRASLHEASVANIVKNARIPRGSFYQYFEDKEDAFYYLLEQETKEHSSKFILYLKRNNGDIATAFIETFRMMLTEYQDKEDRDFFKNAFLNMNHEMESKLAQGFNKEEFEKRLENILIHVDIKKLNISSDEEVIHVLQIIMAITFQNMINHFSKRYTFEEAIANYKFELNLLKKGLYKK